MKKYRLWLKYGLTSVGMCLAMAVVSSILVAGDSQSVKYLLRWGTGYFVNVLLILVAVYHTIIYKTLLPLTLSLGSDRKTALRGLALARWVPPAACLLLGCGLPAAFGISALEGLLSGLCISGLLLVNGAVSGLLGICALEKGKAGWFRLAAMLCSMLSVGIFNYVVWFNEGMDMQRLLIGAAGAMGIGVLLQAIAWNADKNLLRRYTVNL